jgi:hypothetical protein
LRRLARREKRLHGEIEDEVEARYAIRRRTRAGRKAGDGSVEGAEIALQRFDATGPAGDRATGRDGTRREQRDVERSGERLRGFARRVGGFAGHHEHVAVGFVRNGGNGFAEGREASAASAEIFGAHSAAREDHPSRSSNSRSWRSAPPFPLACNSGTDASRDILDAASSCSLPSGFRES